MTIKNVTTRALATGAAALLLLTGCDNPGDESIEPVDTTQAPPADSDPGQDEDATTEQDDGGASSADEAPAGAGSDQADLLSAIDLAESETGGVAFELDEDDGGTWEIHVADGEDELEVLISADGAEVLGVEPDGRLSGDDRQALDVAALTLAEAVQAAAEHATGLVDSVDLDEEDGMFAWEVSFTDDTEVYIDVQTGEVVKVESD